jgi:hypothetical protein
MINVSVRVVRSLRSVVERINNISLKFFCGETGISYIPPKNEFWVRSPAGELYGSVV